MGTEQRKKYLKMISSRECSLRSGLSHVAQRIKFCKKIIALSPSDVESECWRTYKEECRTYKAIKGAVKKQIPAKPANVIVDDYNCYMAIECQCGCSIEPNVSEDLKDLCYCPMCGQKQDLSEIKHRRTMVMQAQNNAGKIIKRNSDETCFI